MDPTNKVIAAEDLAIKKSINVSTLFDTYRSNTIDGSEGFWRRMMVVKSLDLSLERNNEQAVGIALTRAIEVMYKGNLLFTLAPQYFVKLENFNISTSHGDVNDAFATIFALEGEIPIKWTKYQSKNKFIAMAFKILNSKTVTVSDVNDVIRLTHPNFTKPTDAVKYTKGKSLSHKKTKKVKGQLILQALKQSSKGVASQTNSLYEALVILLGVDESILVKSILIEYLIHFSKIKTFK